jgi:hypothetical protein
MPARNDGHDGPDPKAVSPLDCFANTRNDCLAGTTRQLPPLHSLASILAHYSFLIAHLSTSLPARTTRLPSRHWIASPSRTRNDDSPDGSPALAPLDYFAASVSRNDDSPADSPALSPLDRFALLAMTTPRTTRQPPRHWIASLCSQ